MQSFRHATFRMAAVLLLALASLAAGLTSASAAPACTPDVTFNLWAKTGTITLGGTAIPVWGYAVNEGDPAGVPGPELVVTQGACVGVTLTNTLGEATALLFPGQEMIPDTNGAAANGGTATYVFLAGQPGTYLYEAGLLLNAQHQVAMGLYGALVVRPAATPPAGFTGQVYALAGTAFNQEAVLVLSEIDPALNNIAALQPGKTPANFDMRAYAPKYFLINGQVFPGTSAIPAAPGEVVALRYLNAGLRAHAMAALGLHQTAIGMDGSPFLYAHGMVSESIAPGQTSDVLVTIPPAAVDGSRFAVYDSSLFLHNGSASGTGGMLTFLAVSAAPPSGDTTGPVTSGATVSPTLVSGANSVTVSATVSDTTTGGANVAGAEFAIDSTGGTMYALAAADSAFDSPTEAVAGTIPPAIVSGLSTGSHTIYVHGQDVLGNWGPFTSAVLQVDNTGPATSGVSLSPAASSGTVNVALSATGDDRAAGGSSIAAAEYTIDNLPAVGMTVSPSGATVAGLTASIPAATIASLSEGVYALAVHSQDSLGNWGQISVVNLVVDRTGPLAGSPGAAPAATNGTQGYNSSTPAVRVTGTFTDTLATVGGAEGFIDTVKTNGTGFVFKASDGVFNTAVEKGYADVPLTTLNALPEGLHTIYVHGKDVVGNWGPTATVIVNLDKTKPAVTAPSANPNPTNTTSTNNTSFTLSATATDPDPAGAAIPSGIVAAEWYEGADPGAGKGNAMTGTFGGPSVAIQASIDFVARGWTAGTHTLSVRAKDAAGSWSTPVSIGVNVVLPNNIFADGFDSGGFNAWSATGGTTGRISASTTTPQAGGYKMQASISGGASGYVQDNTPLADASYHARFYFNPNGYTTGNGGNPAAVTIFTGLTSTNGTVFQVQYRRSSTTGYQVRLGVQVGTAPGITTFTGWSTIPNGSWNRIEIAWQSAGSAAVSLTINGGTAVNLAVLNTSAYLLDAVRLGPQGTLPNTGTVFFDTFASTRRTVIGP